MFSKKSNLYKIQITQNKIFCLTLFYIFNQTLHTNLKMNTVLKTAIKSYTFYHNSLSDHPNILANRCPVILPKD